MEFKVKTRGAPQTHSANRFKITDDNKNRDSLSCLSLNILVIILKLVEWPRGVGVTELHKTCMCSLFYYTFDNLI